MNSPAKPGRTPAPNLEPRTPGQSRAVLSQVMEIGDANLENNVHGGVIMKLVDSAAGISAVKHCGGRVVTASMDEMSFIEPVFLGEVVTLYAQVNDVGRTSMEVGVRVHAENARTGEHRHVSSAYLVFVALNAKGMPRPVPPLAPQTDEEKRRRDEAKIRRQHRLARKEAILARRERESDGGSA
ncbi:MAG: acyl-CoA thioesterase [Actinomycetota bacterium]